MREDHHRDREAERVPGVYAGALATVQHRLFEEERRKAEAEKPKPKYSLDDYLRDNSEREKSGLPHISYGQWVIQKENIKVKVERTKNE